MESPKSHEDRDKRHIGLLSVFHFIVGGGRLLISMIYLLLILRLEMNKFDALAVQPGSEQVPSASMTQDPQNFLWLIGVVILFVFLTFFWSLLTIYVGWRMRKYKSRPLTLMNAVINCLFFPIGTVLGIFTLTILFRDSVKSLYSRETVQ